MLTNSQNATKEITTGERKPRIDLFRTCVAAIPRYDPLLLTLLAGRAPRPAAHAHQGAERHQGAGDHHGRAQAEDRPIQDVRRCYPEV
ncbi:putative Heat containing protein [Operophtera brumata]|uniref:Putative Heat containing protein n=1 Tax=Operophtera brumata TaxID=104452 RepID=A0A0L7LR25_OPEBR|nr:putative Heat containing protein [Operophtera brumata]